MKAKLSNTGRHLLFWLVFVLLWSTHDLNYHRDFGENLFTNLYTFIPYALLVYFNLYFLTPLFLLKKRITSYLSFLILGIGLTTWFTSNYLYFYFSALNIYMPTAIFFSSFEGKIAIVTEIIIALGLSMTLFLLDQWYRKDRVLKEIEQKRLETELTLLKNQINPHFLFNSLNSIYVLLGKNLVDGKKMLLQFSDLLSHQLYETNKKRVRLDEELVNLKNYINIEGIRHEDLLHISFSLPTGTKNLLIAPMLLLPIIENAFKHGQSSKGYKIVIASSIRSGNVLQFSVENSIPISIKKSQHPSKKGIGLANLKRRLELIYPNRHKFRTLNNDLKFTVHLEIQLDKNKMPNS